MLGDAAAAARRVHFSTRWTWFAERASLRSSSTAARGKVVTTESPRAAVVPGSTSTGDRLGLRSVAGRGGGGEVQFGNGGWTRCGVCSLPTSGAQRYTRWVSRR